jgi:hypothetical protein
MANPSKQNALFADATDRPLIGNAQTLVSDASVAHALNAVFSDTEAEAALNALGVKINAVLDILEEHGLMKSS